MNMAFRNRKPNDLPLFGQIIRERKGVYVCVISFKQSRHHYDDELVCAKNLGAAKAHLRKLYPTITFKR